MFGTRSLCSAIFVVALFVFGTAAAFGQSVLWRSIDDTALSRRPLVRTRTPDNYGTFALDKTILRQLLVSAPEEGRSSISGAVIDLPLPDGTMGRFRFEHSLVVEPGLLVHYPELGQTYRASGIDDPTASARFDMLPSGFHAMILSEKGTVLVDPYAAGDTDNYVSYMKNDLPRIDDFKCEVGDARGSGILSVDAYDPGGFVQAPAPEISSGTQLRTYRLALAADNEYCVAVGGNTIAGSLAAEVLIMNRVNGVYERDVAIHMNIVANNNLITFAGDNTRCTPAPTACTTANDPYTDANGSTMLSQNTTALNATGSIGSANYDIGHVFSTGGGGIAGLGVACSTSKAQGVTGLPTPVGDAFAIDYVAHEMGHEWGANHTFNGNVSNCGSGNRAANDSYEPGSGITIMAYAGICGSQDLSAHSIDTFHEKSLEEIVAYSQTGTGNSCAVTTSSGNSVPSVSVVGGPFNIPKQTPFTLTATGSDVDGDTLTYDWEEYDLGTGSGTSAVPNSDAGGAIPILRPYSPTAGPSRTFPSLTYILNNANVPPATNGIICPSGNGCLTGELLPQIGRTMSFKVVARDNHLGTGGINTATATVNVDGNSGPFAITSPNTNVTYAGNSVQTVTWNVASTNASTVNAANVKISFSTDGGNTFPTVLLASTPNNGSASVTIPNVTTTTARIKVEAVGNIFFDISDTNFTVNAAAVSHTASDFDGDGKSDISVWRSTDGVWYRLNSSDSTFSATQFGQAGDMIVPGDYDGDGKTDIAVWRPSNGVWYIQQSRDGFTAAQFGLSTDLPAQGDFDGDGKADIAVYRPASGVWFLQQSKNGFAAQQFGTAEDRPVPADYDGDGSTDIAVFRPSTGVWYVNRSRDGFEAVQFGVSTDKVAPADYDGDGKADFVVYRGSVGVWYLLRSNLGFTAVGFGTVGDIPAPGDFDGDGSADISVYRPSQGVWYRLNSSNSAFSATQFGNAIDKPTEAGYVAVQ